MSKKYKPILAALFAIGVVVLAVNFLRTHHLAVLTPKGLIATQERHLMITATLLMLIVVIPVFVMTAAIAWRYREGNKNAKYTPDWDHHFGAEFTWWAIPSVIIAILAVITWQSSHQLDPFKPLAGSTKPLNVQVVALQWKWLFIYPDQHIATVNYLQLPEATPINFEITADAPMNSFWIPQLGGQIYAMAGMSTQMHLIADQTGTFEGVSANLSGRGFAGMKFQAKATTMADFNTWVDSVKKSQNKLDLTAYNHLAAPSVNNPRLSFSQPDEDLYDGIMMKYMMPMSLPTSTLLQSEVSAASAHHAYTTEQQ
jgi:cytochrome o ubiquinol oxidase subunit 2